MHQLSDAENMNIFYIFNCNTRFWNFKNQSKNKNKQMQLAFFQLTAFC